MKYLGIDVHSDASVWCLLDEAGTQLGTGRTKTSSLALCELATELGKDGDLVVGQEVGTQVYLVHDAISSAGVPVLSFNVAHLRIIAASRKKTDRRDAYWIAKSLQTGMTLTRCTPGGEIRELRRLLARRSLLKRDLKRWQVRARALLRAHGHRVRAGGHYINKLVAELLERVEGLDTDVVESLGTCERFIDMLCEEVAHVDAMLAARTEKNDVITRLQTIPGIGPVASATIYATVGEIGVSGTRGCSPPTRGWCRACARAATAISLDGSRRRARSRFVPRWSSARTSYRARAATMRHRFAPTSIGSAGREGDARSRWSPSHVTCSASPSMCGRTARPTTPGGSPPTEFLSQGCRHQRSQIRSGRVLPWAPPPEHADG